MIIKIGDKEFNFDGYANINEIAKAFDEAQNKAYQQGRADGYSQAENDYHKQTEKDRKSSYDCGYEQGITDAIDECIDTLYEVTPQTIDEKLDMVFVNALKQLKERIK